MIHFHHTASDLAAILDAIAKGAAITIGILAVIAWRESNKQRRADLRWKQAEQGKRLWDEIIGNAKCVDALQMIEPSTRPYIISDVTRDITHKRAMEGLKPGPSADPVDRFICDAFDELLYHFDRLGNHLQNELVLVEDIVSPTEYYVSRMALDKVIYTEYLKALHYRRALHLLEQFPTWMQAPAPPE